MRIRSVVVSLGMFAVGCSSTESTSELVAVEANELGISSVEITHDGQGADRDLVVTGYDDNGLLKATVSLHTGQVYFEAEWSPGQWLFGTDLVIAAGDQSYHRVTPGIEAHEKHVQPGLAEFVRLAPVARAIENESAIRFAPVSDEVSFVAATCDGVNFPVANGNPTQCCQDSFIQEFKIATSGKLATRSLSPYGACRSAGGGSCVGSQCMYGPCAAEAWGPTGDANAKVFTPTSQPTRCGWDDNGAAAGGNNYPEAYTSQATKPGVTATCPYTQCNSYGDPSNLLNFAVTSDSATGGHFGAGSSSTNPQSYVASQTVSPGYTTYGLIPNGSSVYVWASPSSSGRPTWISGACSAFGTSATVSCTIPSGAADKSITIKQY